MASLNHTPLNPQAWQDTLKSQLIERNNSESAYATIIDQYRKLAKQTKLLKERNQALLRAATSTKPSDGRSGPSSGLSTTEDNPVLQAYVSSLEGTINGLRTELSDVYKNQGQNTQKLLTLTETIQEKDHQARLDQEELRRLTDGETRWKRGTEEWSERLRIKDHDIQNLQDEITTLNLELSQVLLRNEALKADNANLLNRWIEKMNDEVDGMNMANEFVELSKDSAIDRTKDVHLSSPNGAPMASSAKDF
ncbi:Autophagy-related protein 16 [Phaffia rhodozyma]|uniref:Autophagy-related protein 16 n=1 Tax=Phaffia rhodozyma TaxID=264483 RepID=A0A0F7SL69_PHARH|nr:Autophagy-related protein 16 [Phaffia rhodozyma]